MSFFPVNLLEILRLPNVTAVDKVTLVTVAIHNGITVQKLLQALNRPDTYRRTITRSLENMMSRGFIKRKLGPMIRGGQTYIYRVSHDTVHRQRPRSNPRKRLASGGQGQPEAPHSIG